MADKIEVKLDFDAQDVQRQLMRLEEREIPFAMALTATRTAKAAQLALKDEISRVFDNPTPWILNSTYILAAKKSDPKAVVYAREWGGTPAPTTLTPQIEGGERQYKRSEGALRAGGYLPNGWQVAPGPGAKRDKYGNINRGQTVVMQCSSQIGKSEMQLNVMGYFTDQEPSPQLMIYPTVEAAEAFSKERIDPTFKYSPGLKNKLREGKEGRGAAKKSSTTIRMKHYAGGYVALVGANSPAGLASRPIRILLADEIDRYGVTQEGDPLKLGIQRTTNFHNRKKVFVSTPVLEKTSNIHKWFKLSDQRYYHVPCPCCGAMQVLKWSQVKWDKNDMGEALPETARYECRECGDVISIAGGLQSVSYVRLTGEG